MIIRHPYFTKDFIDKKLEILSTESAIILTLYLIKKKSQKDIAIELSYPISSVKHKITKAMLELRKVSNDPNYLKAMEILNKK